MARLLATVVVALLLLGSGVDAVVLAAQAEAPCAGQCGCNEDLHEGPVLERSCCCAAAPAETPEPRPLPPFTESGQDLPTAVAAAVLPAPMPSAEPACEPHGLRPMPPRAPPGALWRLHCVQRC